MAERLGNRANNQKVTGSIPSRAKNAVVSFTLLASEIEIGRAHV